jgi:hypothetical protein
LHSNLLHILYFQTYVCNHSQWSVVFLVYDQCISGSCTSEEEIEEVVSVDFVEVIEIVFPFGSLSHAYWCTLAEGTNDLPEVVLLLLPLFLLLPRPPPPPPP